MEAKTAEKIILHDTFMEQIWVIEEEKRNVEHELLQKLQKHEAEANEKN